MQLQGTKERTCTLVEKENNHIIQSIQILKSIGIREAQKII